MATETRAQSISSEDDFDMRDDEPVTILKKPVPKKLSVDIPL